MGVKRYWEMAQYLGTAVVVCVYGDRQVLFDWTHSLFSCESSQRSDAVCECLSRRELVCDSYQLSVSIELL